MQPQVILACSVALLGIALAMAGEAPSPATLPADSAQTAQSATPSQVVEQASSQIIDLLKDNSLSTEQRRQQLDQLLSRYIDFATLSRLILGPHWQTLTSPQQQAFAQELRTYLLQIYLPLTTEYRGQQVQIVQERPMRQGDQIVSLQITDQKGGHTRQIATLSCRMRNGQRPWRIADLTIEGINISRLFAAQFRPVVEREGGEGLLQRLRQRNKQNGAPASN